MPFRYDVDVEYRRPIRSKPSEDTSATFTLSSPTGVTFKCSLDASPFHPCGAAGVSYQILTAGPHTFAAEAVDASGRAGTPTTYDWIIAPSWNYERIDNTDEQIAPPGLVSTMGGTVLWKNYGPSQHTVTDKSGLALFDSGAIGAGGEFRVTLHAAGKYIYTCTLHPANGNRTIHITPDTTPNVGTTTTAFQVIWADRLAPAGLVYEVEIQRPGETAWEPWQTDVT